MKNMKREYKFLLIILVLMFLGVGLQYVLVARPQENTKKIAEELDDKKSQLLRDELIQQKVYLSRDMFDANIKSNENFTIVNTGFIERLQNLMTISDVKYNPNDFQQVNTEDVIENNLAFYTFELSFTSEYSSLLKFIKNLEKDKLIFDIVDLNITKVKEESAPTMNPDGTVAAPAPVSNKGPVKVSMRIQITKFI